MINYINIINCSLNGDIFTHNRIKQVDQTPHIRNVASSTVGQDFQYAISRQNNQKYVANNINCRHSSWYNFRIKFEGLEKNTQITTKLYSFSYISNESSTKNLKHTNENVAITTTNRTTISQIRFCCNRCDLLRLFLNWGCSSQQLNMGSLSQQPLGKHLVGSLTSVSMDSSGLSDSVTAPSIDPASTSSFDNWVSGDRFRV